jgi:hypothetical protein
VPSNLKTILRVSTEAQSFIASFRDAMRDRGYVEGQNIAFAAQSHRAARYWTHRFSADVTGIDLNPSRVRGAEEPTASVGLESHRRFGLARLIGEPIRSS